ncbi:MAG: proteobacterial dedicated sortase system response regulator [Gammaproteobacteria bacterium]|nr:proteobacterial dedicated sortase system response regulator [Gammaproteobacteria bacterium]
MKPRIAIVEDEAALRENYLEALRRRGYEASGYPGRAEALAAFGARLPDLVIIDINLGDEVEGGFELCRTLRHRSTTLPLIFLTARDSEIDAVSGLRLGADDYLTKDISLEHLCARVAALLRRVSALSAAADAPGEPLRRGPLELDADRFTVRWRGEEIALSLTEFWLLHALARYPGHVKNRQQLMDAASVVLDDSTITSQIKRIRRKFQAVDARFDAIETVYGAGYRWRGSAAEDP